MPPVCGQGRWITLNKHIHTAVVIPLLLPSETEVGGTLALLQSVLASGHRGGGDPGTEGLSRVGNSTREGLSWRTK